MVHGRLETVRYTSTAARKVIETKNCVIERLKVYSVHWQFPHTMSLSHSAITRELIFSDSVHYC